MKQRDTFAIAELLAFTSITDKHVLNVFPPTCMRSFVDLEVLAAREHFSAAWKRALERPFSGVDADVVDQLVLGLERSTMAGAAEPATRVIRLLGPAHVLDGQVYDGFLDAGEPSTTRSGGGRRLLLDDGR